MSKSRLSYRQRERLIRLKIKRENGDQLYKPLHEKDFLFVALKGDVPPGQFCTGGCIYHFRNGLGIKCRLVDKPIFNGEKICGMNRGQDS